MKYLALLALLTVAGCTTAPTPAVSPAQSPAPVARTGDNNADLPSAASDYCRKKHGKTEYYNRSKGLVAYCHLPNGEVIDQLELYQLRGKEAI